MEDKYKNIVTTLVTTYNEQTRITKAKVEVREQIFVDKIVLSLYKTYESFPNRLFGIDKDDDPNDTVLLKTIITTGSSEDTYKELCKYIMFACTQK